jgi:Lipocalin-like domain
LPKDWRKTVKRRIILSLCAATVLGLALLPGAAVSQQKSLTEQLVGSWTIISNDNVAPDGTKRQIFGPNPKGIFILGADGSYALVVVNPARPKFVGKSRLDGTPEENKSAIAGTVASFGTWSVDEATNTLVTSIEGNLFPNDEGRDQRRIIALEGDQLKMVNPSPGSGGRAEIVFRRAK